MVQIPKPMIALYLDEDNHFTAFLTLQCGASQTLLTLQGKRSRVVLQNSSKWYGLLSLKSSEFDSTMSRSLALADQILTSAVSDMDMLFGRLWTQRQYCQGSLHQGFFYFYIFFTILRNKQSNKKFAKMDLYRWTKRPQGSFHRLKRRKSAGWHVQLCFAISNGGMGVTAVSYGGKCLHTGWDAIASTFNHFSRL